MRIPASLAILFVCLWALASAADPPKLPETFTAAVTITEKDSRGSVTGKGIWAVDQPGNKGLEHYTFSNAAFDIYELQRYDLNRTFAVSNENKTECHEFRTSGEMPHVWEWLSTAKFAGTNDSVDIWKSDIGYADLTLGVKASDPSTPVYLIRTARERETRYDFAQWNATTPDASFFAVPSDCKENFTAPAKPKRACVPTATAIAHAKVWAAANIPYNQGATYQGYREDCSGFVSMCWESSQPGHTTETMDEISHAIAKDDLAPGDCLLYAAEHVVLFGGWTNADHSEYQAYEETKPGEGTVTRPTPYPYWYSQSSFKPYRYNNIC